MLSIEELHQHILKYIQGGFSEADMMILKEEIEKLEAGDIYVEIGVDEGRSARVAHEYAHSMVYKIWIDIHDPDAVKGITMGRRKWMEQEGMVGIGKRGFYVHGDADELPWVMKNWIKLLFIDGHHDYESVKKNTLVWEPRVWKNGGTILFHDYDHPESKRWLDEHYGNKKEVVAGGKIVRVRL